MIYQYTAEVEFLDAKENQVDIGVTFFGPYGLVSGQMRLRFDSIDHAIQHLLLDYEIMLTVFDCEDLENRESVTAPVNFESSEEFIEEIHHQYSSANWDLFSSFKEPQRIYPIIDLRGYDYVLVRAPKMDNQSIANAVQESGRPDSFYFLAEDDDPFEPIKDVHFLTKDERYIRKNGSWKVMNPVEWEKMDGMMDWQIDPNQGVEFLEIFDRSGMQLIDAKPFALPDIEYAAAEVSANNASDVSNRRSDQNARSNYFECMVYDDEIHVHPIKNSVIPVSSDEISYFDHYGGYLFTSRSEWVLHIPVDNSMSPDDYETDFENLVRQLPNSMPETMSCGEWIDDLNNLGRCRFEISKEPLTIGYGNFKSFVRRYESGNEPRHGWVVLEGKL